MEKPLGKDTSVLFKDEINFYFLVGSGRKIDSLFA